MPNLPHDQYLDYVDPEVHSKILDFHELTNYIIHESTEHSSRLHYHDPGTISMLTGNQLEITPCGLRLNHEALEPLAEDHPLMRAESLDYFPPSEITFESIVQLMRPLVCRTESRLKRGYPSGGALYPVETFLCRLTNKISGWPCREDILHLLPQEKSFEKLEAQHGRLHLRKAIIPATLDIGEPAAALVLIAYLPKSIFKYKYRGYRLALMETGAIYQLVDMASKHNQLGTRVWAGFCDHMITSSLGLNPTLYLTTCTVLIGKAK